MPVPGRMALVIVAGGVALGSMLSGAVNPEPKKPPEAPWRGALQAPVVADASYLTVEAPPQDLSPYQDSYAPTWAREELTNWEPEYPAWTYSEWVEEPSATPSPADPSPAEEAGIDAQRVATAAEAAAAPETAARTIAPAEPAPEPDPASYPRLASHLDDLY